VPADDITDPRVVPRWVEAGVSGIPRAREWDAVAVIEIPELEGLPLAELSLRVLGDGAVVAEEEDIPRAAVERLGAAAAAAVDPPCEAQASRRGGREWSLAVRGLRLIPIMLPGGIEAEELAVALAPEGSRTLLVDGEEVETPPPGFAEAFSLIEEHGREHHVAFVARAERVAPGRWELTLDPL
jgi:hypothetical protein